MAEETEQKEATLAPDDAETASPVPKTAEGLAGKAKDLQALRDAVVDAASVGAGLWFSYLFVPFYLLIAVGGVTHRDLLLESPVRLPLLNVDLPLLGFFWLGPLIFLIVQALHLDRANRCNPGKSRPSETSVRITTLASRTTKSASPKFGRRLAARPKGHLTCVMGCSGV